MDILPSEEEQMLKNVAREFLETEVNYQEIDDLVCQAMG